MSLPAPNQCHAISRFYTDLFDFARQMLVLLVRDNEEGLGHCTKVVMVNTGSELTVGVR